MKILNEFLKAWKDKNYSKMYDCLSKTSQSKITKSEYVPLFKSSKEIKFDKWKITKINTITSCNKSAYVKLDNNYKYDKIGIVKESDSYTPDRNGEWGIVIFTIYPFLYPKEIK